MKTLLRALALAVALLAAPPANALCVSPLCSCSVSTTALVFGSLNPLSAANTDSTGNVRVSCGGVAGLTIPYTVALGTGTTGQVAARTMASGANRLAYNLYTTSGYSTVWGDGSGSSVVMNGSFLLSVLGTAPPQDITVYGRIPGSQPGVAPGSYGDTVVVTLTYF